MPNFAVIHAERPEHLAILRQDGGRPGGPQPTLQNNASEVGPIRMRKDVRDEDRLPKVSGCAARAGIWTNARSISCCPVRFGQVGSGAVSQVQSVVVSQEN